MSTAPNILRGIRTGSNLRLDNVLAMTGFNIIEAGAFITHKMTTLKTSVTKDYGFYQNSKFAPYQPIPTKSRLFTPYVKVYYRVKSMLLSPVLRFI